MRADGDRRQTAFSITFNQPPDFRHADEFGRAVNAFQYFYDTQPVADEFSGDDVKIIRGSEIRFANTIPIRESLNPKGRDFPHAEGWGPTRGEVPFELDGARLSFTVPWKVLGETDGKFAYRLFAFENGSETNDVGAVFIPLPPAAWSGGGLLLLSGFGILLRRKCNVVNRTKSAAAWRSGHVVRLVRGGRGTTSAADGFAGTDRGVGDGRGLVLWTRVLRSDRLRLRP